jgi:phosphoesterase RecJ-like protein
VLVVDHHATNTRYGDINLVDADAAASAMLVLELVDRLGVPVDADVATCLYTALSTDTGSFRFAATTPEVHHVAARVLATGFRHDEVSRAIWDTHRVPYLKLLGRLIDRATVVQPDSVIWTWVSQRDLTEADVALDEIEGVIDVLRTADEAEVAVVCKQAPDGRWLVSMRSKGAVDVGAVAVRLGGGGHRFAAGFTADPAPPELMRVVLDALRSGQTA